MFKARNVKNRIVEFPRRHKLINVATGQVLGTYDFEPVPGTVTEEGTIINKTYLQPIEDTLDNVPYLMRDVANLKLYQDASQRIDGTDVQLIGADASGAEVGMSEESQLATSKYNYGVGTTEFDIACDKGGFEKNQEICIQNGNNKYNRIISSVIDSPKYDYLKFEGASLTTTTFYDERTQIVEIPNDRFVMIFKSSAYIISAIVGELDTDGNVTFLSPAVQVVNMGTSSTQTATNSNNGLPIVSMGDGRIVFSFTYSGTSYLKCLSVSDDNIITQGVHFTISSNQTYYDLRFLADDRIVVRSYYSGNMYLQLIKIVGTTYSTNTSIASFNTDYGTTLFTILSPTLIIAGQAYSGKGYKIYTINGMTSTAGSTTYLVGYLVSNGWGTLVTLSQTKALLLSGGGSNTNIQGQVLNIIDGVITAGTSSIIYSQAYLVQSPQLTAISTEEGRALVMFMVSTSNVRYCVVVSEADGVISAKPAIDIFGGSSTQYSYVTYPVVFSPHRVNLFCFKTGGIISTSNKEENIITLSNGVPVSLPATTSYFYRSRTLKEDSKIKFPSGVTTTSIRYKVTSNRDFGNIMLFIYRNLVEGFTVDVSVCIDDGTQAESYTDLIQDTPINTGTIYEVLAYLQTVLAKGSNIIIKLELNKLSTSDDAYITKILGGVE